MKTHTLTFVVLLGMFATACFAWNPAPAVAEDTVKSPRDSASGQASGKRSAMDTPVAAVNTVKSPRDSASGQASGKRSAMDFPGVPGNPANSAFKKVGTGAVITPETGALNRTYNNCRYDDRGRVTNAPCTGTQKDDKGVIWWP